MIKTTYLSEDNITRTKGGNATVEKRTLEEAAEITLLNVPPWTAVKMHGHDKQWEVYAWGDCRKAYVCLIDEEHELVNNSDTELNIMAVKGRTNYSYDEIAEMFFLWGYSVYHGSLIVK